MERLIPLLYIAVLLPHCWLTAVAQTACPLSTQRVISYDTSLLPPSAITATNEDSASNPADQLFGRNNVPFNLWCTAPESGIQHQINVSFTEQVVIMGIISSGFANGYVAEFAVEYSTSTPPDGPLMYKVFHVPEIDIVFTLQDSPLTAQWLGLTIHDGVIAPSGRLCWHLTLFGCRYSQAIQKTQEKSHHPPTSSFVQSTSVLISSRISIHSTSTLPSTSPADEQPTAVLTVTEVVRDYRVLIFAVPTAVCTTLLVLVIVTVGVLLCLKHGRGRNWRSEHFSRSSREFSKIPSTDTLRVLDNTTLYGKTSTPTSLTLANIDLPHHPRPPHLNLGDSLYENQLSPPPLTQEPHPYEAVTPTRCTAQRTNSMVDNPTYNVPYHPPSPTLPPPPPPPDSPVKPPRIDLINNECYTGSLSSESYANYDTVDDLDYCSTGNIYETPQ